MRINMSEQQAYLNFLRYALQNNKKPLPVQLKTMNWQGLFHFSKIHSIVGVIFNAIEQLSKDAPHPDKDTLFKWLMMYQRIKQLNMQINKDSVKLSQQLLKDGYPSCILKGQGNNTMYPNPLARMPGDIDIWVKGNEGDILNYTRSFDNKAIANYHHVQLQMPNISTPVEIHFTPSFCGNLFYNWRMKKYFNKHANLQFTNKVQLPYGVGEIAIPTPTFNRIFQLSHTMHHFFFEGIGLRQIVDYYYLLQQPITDTEKQQELKVLKYLGMYKFARAMAYVQQYVLGLDAKYMSVKPCEKTGKLFLLEILQAGNMGFYDERYHFKGKSRLGQYCLEVFRNLHYAWYFPAEALFGRPVFRIWHQFEKLRIEQEAKKRKQLNNKN